MLYLIIKWLMRITIQVFFKSIHLSMQGRIPKKAPLLILANHPNMMMDPIVVATLIERRVSFLGKGVLFNGKLSQWILPKLGIIPIHRVQDDPTQLAKNANTFKRVFELFEQGGAILMFPEGISLYARKLQPLKNGAARMAISAEMKHDFKLGLKILIVGLNYDSQHQFNRDLLVYVQEPIDVAEFLKGENYDTGTKTADKLTHLIKEKLESIVISIDDQNNDTLVKGIEKIYKQKVMDELQLDIKNQESNFAVTQKITKAVNHYTHTSPEAVKVMSERIATYLNQLSDLQINDYDLQNPKSFTFTRTNLIAIIKLILAFPFYIYGLINNFLPFEIPIIIGDRVKDKDMKGSVSMVVGTFTFLIFYTFQIIVIQSLFQTYMLSLLYALSLPISGFFAFYYWHAMMRVKDDFYRMRMYTSKHEIIGQLKIAREKIIADLDQYRDAFFNAQAS